MSDIIAREVKLDDKDNSVKVLLDEDPSNHAEHIKDYVSVGCDIAGDFHASVKLGPQ